MASSVVFKGNSSSSSDLENTRSKEMEISLMNVLGEKPTRVLAGKPGGGSGGRRKSKANESADQKKVRRRGVGVEQLERLSFQERFKTMTEIKPSHPLSFHNQQFTALPTTPAFGGYSIINGRGGGVGPVGLDVQQSALFAEHESKFLAVDHPFAVGLGFRGTELSSIPNHTKWSPECGICYKKFRGNGDQNLLCNGERKMCGEMYGFSNVGSKAGSMFNGGNPYYAISKPTGQEVEVTAVHRKGTDTGGSGGGGSVLMEYEFFPGKVGASYYNYKDIINMASFSSSSSWDNHHNQGLIHGVGESAAGGGSNDPIDLSLKLSY